LASRTSPWRPWATFSSTGVRTRQGGHQSAQKSTIIERFREASSTFSEKSVSVASKIRGWDILELILESAWIYRATIGIR
jgi:hypothetical protein